MYVTLASIHSFLHKQGMDVRLAHADDQIPLDRLIVDFGTDEQNNHQRMSLYIVEKKVGAVSESSESVVSALFIHLYMLLPMNIQDQAVGEVARYLLLINKSLEFEGFGMSEVDRRIYFRHDLYCSMDEVADEVLLGLIGSILLAVDAFSPYIDGIASGKMSFLQTIEETLSTPSDFPSK